jgi:hypothetical protein
VALKKELNDRIKALKAEGEQEAKGGFGAQFVILLRSFEVTPIFAAKSC